MYTERMVAALFDVRSHRYVIAYQLFIENELTPVRDSCRVVVIWEDRGAEVIQLVPKEVAEGLVELRRMLPVWCQRQISEAVGAVLSEIP